MSIGNLFLYLDTKNGTIEKIKFRSWICRRLTNDILVEECDIGFWNKDWSALVLASDGIPECIYDQPTISSEELVGLLMASIVQSLLFKEFTPWPWTKVEKTILHLLRYIIM